MLTIMKTKVNKKLVKKTNKNKNNVNPTLSNKTMLGLSLLNSPWETINPERGASASFNIFPVKDDTTMFTGTKIHVFLNKENNQISHFDMDIYSQKWDENNIHKVIKKYNRIKNENVFGLINNRLNVINNIHKTWKPLTMQETITETKPETEKTTETTETTQETTK